MKFVNNNEDKEEKKRREAGDGGDGEDVPERGNWTGKLDFLLSCLGYAVGLGNVWRFPYLCFKNGGGAFLVPYFFMLLCIGIPCFLLELSIGQYSARGPVTVYGQMSPMFKGLGIANMVANAFVGLYYNMIIAWTIYYLFASFTSHLPWQDCTNNFNDENCFSIIEYTKCLEQRNTTSDLIYIDRQCSNDPEFFNSIMARKDYWYKHEKEIELENKTKTKVDCYYINTTFCNENATQADIVKPFDLPVGKRDSSSSQYLKKEVLKEAKSIEPSDFGSPDWKLALCLLAAWLVIFLCLVKGIKSSGKVVYFTATFPYLVLVVLLIKAVTLPGASDGIYFYLVPDLNRLGDIEVWVAAAGQIFFSLSVAGGGLITLASYNTFNNNILRDTLIVCVGNCMTSFVAGFAIFSVLGFMASEIGVNIQDVATSGTGLAFVAYPDLVTRLTPAPLWAILFFLMLFTLGLDSQFAIVENMLTGVLDYEPKLRSKKLYVVACICVSGFLCGLPLTCPGGGFLLDLLDNYAAVWPYLFIGFTELVLVSYVYGYNTFIDDIVEMTNAKWLNGGVKYFFGVFYCFISPLLIIIILLISWAQYEPFKKGDYTYPGWANGIGWFIAMFCILSVPFVMIAYVFYKWFSNGRPSSSSDIMDILDESSKPTENWRSNAFKSYEQGETKADFVYEESGDGRGPVRRRAHEMAAGMDNKAWRKSSELTSL
eukprot:TRINITY_DN3067_c0_g1_i4.p1 TRINITY_DN3067_c0_g1~~TRINITY_DN3067_c0_g1_i4.p1  ORF type:complete len:711 (+),score=155.03 TRINITY_DN3067_c0_g1_i4:47-2179(+)